MHGLGAANFHTVWSMIWGKIPWQQAK